MNPALRITALFAALVLAGPSHAASKVYRCGADGREYSQTPCKDGRAVDTDDPRSAEQRRDGRSVAEGQTRLARQLEAERRAREAAAKTQGAAGIKPPPPAEPASAAKGKKKRIKNNNEADGTARLPAKKTPP